MDPKPRQPPERHADDERLMPVPLVPVPKRAALNAGAAGLAGALAGAMLGALIGTVLWLAGVAAIPAFVAAIVAGAAGGAIFAGFGAGLTAMQNEAEAEGWEGPDSSSPSHKRAFGV